VREAFQILTQGVEMVHYDMSAKGGARKSKKIVWMVSASNVYLVVLRCPFEILYIN
jgi:prophage antirepressor-like protein